MTIPQRLLPAQKIRQSSIFTTGLALFSMFFGAGNLVFPLLIGQTVGAENVWFAIAGLGLTAVIVPFVGLASMLLFQANYYKFFFRIGKVPGGMLLLLLQLILGPIGVIPRLITLMHAMAAPYLLDIPLFLFSVLAVGVVFGCSFKKEVLIRFLGAILTPILLLSLAALIFSGLIRETSISPSELSSGDSFLRGLEGGYNTMDLIAAFLFATVILPHFQKDVENVHENQGQLLKKMALTSAIAATLLLLTYVGLCLVSAQRVLDVSCLPELMLGAIALDLLGPFGVGIAAVAVITACLTTAITLSSIFADYLRKDLFKEKIGSKASLLITLFIALLFSMMGFQEIIGFLGPILQVVYPGLILLAVLNLLHVLYGQKSVKTPVFLTFTASAVIYLVQRFC